MKLSKSEMNQIEKTENKTKGSLLTNQHPNKAILDNLQVLLDYNKEIKQPFKVKAYQNAINNVKKLPYQINLANIETIKKQKLIGDKTYKKIIELLKTDKITEVEDILIGKQTELFAVKGFGTSTINKLKQKGIDTIAKLKTAVESGNIKLTHQQALGLKYYTDLSQRIPRSEVTKIAKKLTNLIGKVDFQVVGSYRRQLPNSGDIDILIKGKPDLMKMVHDTIVKASFYVDHLAYGSTKFSFLVKSTQFVRQIDIRIINEQEYPYALVYFTGSGEFNKVMRGIAKQKGLTLNEYNLMTTDGKPIILDSEKEIFRYLGIRYLEPKDRIPDNIVIV